MSLLLWKPIVIFIYFYFFPQLFRVLRYEPCVQITTPLFSLLKVMLHETISNDDFQRNTALQCWNNVVTIRNNVATML